MDAENQETNLEQEEKILPTTERTSSSMERGRLSEPTKIQENENILSNAPTTILEKDVKILSGPPNLFPAIGSNNIPCTDEAEKSNLVEEKEAKNNKSKKEHRSLGRAARKRFPWYCKQGFSKGKARLRAKEPTVFSKEITFFPTKTNKGKNTKPYQPENTKSQEEGENCLSSLTGVSHSGEEMQPNTMKVTKEINKQYLGQGINKEEATLKPFKPTEVIAQISEKKMYSKEKQLSNLCHPNIPSSTGEATNENKIEREQIKNVKITVERIKLCGAARKRFTWYIKQGFNKEEARLRAKEPISVSNFQSPAKKRQRSTETQQKSREIIKRNKIANPGPSEKNTQLKETDSYKQDIGAIKIGLLHKDYPQTLLTFQQLKQIQEDILLEILNMKDNSIKPNFIDSTCKKGWLSLICGDQRTAQWLKRHYEHTLYRIVEEQDIPHPEVAIAYLPNSAADKNDRILQLISSQNCLDTNKWMILNRRSEGTLACVTFSVDQTSAKFIEKDNKIYYKFSKAVIMLKSKQTEENKKYWNTAPRTQDFQNKAKENDTLINSPSVECSDRPLRYSLGTISDTTCTTELSNWQRPVLQNNYRASSGEYFESQSYSLGNLPSNAFTGLEELSTVKTTQRPSFVNVPSSIDKTSVELSELQRPQRHSLKNTSTNAYKASCEEFSAWQRSQTSIVDFPNNTYRYSTAERIESQGPSLRDTSSNAYKASSEEFSVLQSSQKFLADMLGNIYKNISAEVTGPQCPQGPSFGDTSSNANKTSSEEFLILQNTQRPIFADMPSNVHQTTAVGFPKLQQSPQRHYIENPIGNPCKASSKEFSLLQNSQIFSLEDGLSNACRTSGELSELQRPQISYLGNTPGNAYRAPLLEYDFQRPQRFHENVYMASSEEFTRLQGSERPFFENTSNNIASTEDFRTLQRAEISSLGNTPINAYRTPSPQFDFQKSPRSHVYAFQGTSVSKVRNSPRHSPRQKSPNTYRAPSPEFSNQPHSQSYGNMPNNTHKTRSPEFSYQARSQRYENMPNDIHRTPSPEFPNQPKTHKSYRNMPSNIHKTPSPEFRDEPRSHRSYINMSSNTCRTLSPEFSSKPRSCSYGIMFNNIHRTPSPEFPNHPKSQRSYVNMPSSLHRTPSPEFSNQPRSQRSYQKMPSNTRRTPSPEFSHQPRSQRSNENVHSNTNRTPSPEFPNHPKSQRSYRNMPSNMYGTPSPEFSNQSRSQRPYRNLSSNTQGAPSSEFFNRPKPQRFHESMSTSNPHRFHSPVFTNHQRPQRICERMSRNTHRASSPEFSNRQRQQRFCKHKSRNVARSQEFSYQKWPQRFQKTNSKKTYWGR